MKTTLCLLTFNEKECLEVILPQLLERRDLLACDEIFGIDGGSTDGTIDIYKKYDIPFISQKNRGRGDAFHTAYREIDADAYIFFSPDGNEDINDISKFKTYLQDGYDIVIASRMMQGAKNEEDDKLFRFRKWANNIFNFASNVSFRKTGQYVTDSINGFRAITKEAAVRLNQDARDYTIEYQMTIRAFKHKLKIKEFPTTEGERLFGETKAPSIPTGLRFLKCYFKEVLLN